MQKSLIQVVLIICLALVYCEVNANEASNVYQFATPQQGQQFQRLTQHLRCLVCQNESLADSTAPLAADLRQQVYTMVKNGDSDQQVIDFLVSRYGNFVLYKPPLIPETYALWSAPVVLVLLGALILFNFIRRQRRSSGNHV